MFLITTADTRFWKTNEKILFLGEWCKLFGEKNNWSKLDYEVMPYHWDDRERFSADFKYLESTYEKYLELFTDRLNYIHGVNYSVRYWRIVIGVWLRSFIDSLYDRYLSIKEAAVSGLVTNTWICSTTSWTPSEYPSFGHDAYNLYLYSRIIKHIGGISFEEKEIRHIKSESKSSVRQESFLNRLFTETVRQLKKGPRIFLQQGLAVLVVEVYPRLLRRVKSKVIFVGSIYLTLKDQISLQVSLGQIPYLYHGKKILTVPKVVDNNKRCELEFPLGGDSFEQLLNEMLPEQIPMLYVEDYSEIHERVLKISPKTPNVIITAFTINYRRCFEFWAAYNAEVHGTKLVLSQHGGGYGVIRHISLDSHFTRCFDLYYTWGSTLNGNPKVKPMPSLRLGTSNKKLSSSDENGMIMWVGTTAGRYKTFAEGGLAGPHMHSYFDEQRSFYEKVCSEASELLLWRYFNDPWDDLKRMREFAPDLNVQLGLKKQLGKESDFISELKKCRLAIHTANETTYLETIAANFPTLIFWNPVNYAVYESLEPIFDELKDVGILHYSPATAADKLNEIFENPSVWWNTEKVQRARKSFSQTLCKTSDDWLTIWTEELQHLAEKK
jgi:putative transferase (TIGR04331 family)